MLQVNPKRPEQSPQQCDDKRTLAVSTFTQIVVNELRIQLIKNAEFIVLVFDYVALGVEIVVRETEFNQVKQWEFALLAMAAMGLK